MIAPKQARIIFYGTPEIAAHQLQQLVEGGYNIIAVVTQPDKPAGRGRKLSQPAVKQYAMQQNLPLFQPEKLKDDSFRKEIEKLSPDMQIVVAYRMIPESIYRIPKYGTFNLHTSLLPQYRGAAPINRAIMNGEKESGISTFLLNDKIDCGMIIHRKRIAINERMTAGELHDEMMYAAPELIERTIATLLSDNPQLLPQEEIPESELKTAPKLYKEDMLVDWHRSGREIIDHIRGLSPYPAAFAVFNEPQNGKIHRFKLFEAEFHEKKLAFDTIGRLNVTDKGTLEVTCADGVIQITDIQSDGKKRMKTDAFLRGFKIPTPLYAAE